MRAPLVRQKSKRGGAFKLFARLQNHRRELGLVRRIRKMLCLQTKSRSTRVRLSALAVRRAVQEIAAVKLNPRFRGGYFQHAMRERILHACPPLGARSDQDPVL